MKKNENERVVVFESNALLIDVIAKTQNNIYLVFADGKVSVLSNNDLIRHNVAITKRIKNYQEYEYDSMQEIEEIAEKTQ